VARATLIELKSNWSVGRKLLETNHGKSYEPSTCTLDG
jgi:hypothetical protein